MHGPGQFPEAVQGLEEYTLNSRTLSLNFQLMNFRNRVRARDGVCVISRIDSRPWYFGQNTCHIIPRSHFSFV